jgi:hypothetical protein
MLSFGLRFDYGLIDQHDRNVILYEIDAMASLALEALGILTIVECLLAGGADEDFEKVWGEHEEILRQNDSSPQRHRDTEKNKACHPEHSERSGCLLAQARTQIPRFRSSPVATWPLW